MAEIKVSIETTGGGFGAALRAKIEKAVFQGLTATALIAEADAKRSIVKGPKSGRVYQKKNPKRTHQASAPGQPPAQDLGFLSNSIRAEAGPHQSSVDLVASAPYAVHLEYGTRKMAPRPFMRPAGDKAAAQGGAIIKAYVDEALKQE
jgi:HK97 gp10 family phage protein